MARRYRVQLIVGALVLFEEAAITGLDDAAVLVEVVPRAMVALVTYNETRKHETSDMQDTFSEQHGGMVARNGALLKITFYPLI